MLQPKNWIFRPTQESDRLQFINLARLAFTPQTSLVDAEQAVLEQPLNPPGRQGWVVEDAEGQLVARYRYLDLNVFFENVCFPLAGVGGVAVAMEQRGKGVARWMLEQALTEFRDRQLPLSMLYPFQHGFYRHLGWAWVGQPHQFRVATHYLPSYPERANISAYHLSQASQLQAVYQQVASERNGWLQRDAWQWEEFFRVRGGRELYTYVEAGELLGYIVLEFKQPEWLSAQWAVVVQEWVAQTPSAYRGLLGFVASLRDQVAVVVWNTASNDPFPHLLREQRAYPGIANTESEFGLTHRFGEVGGGFMWRLVDWQRALTLRPIQPGAAFALGFQVRDPVFGEETASFVFADGQMQVAQTPATTSLRLTIEQLTQLFCGVRSPLDLHWTGELEVEGDTSLVHNLALAWQARPPFCWDFF